MLSFPDFPSNTLTMMIIGVRTFIPLGMRGPGSPADMGLIQEISRGSCRSEDGMRDERDRAQETLGIAKGKLQNNHDAASIWGLPFSIRKHLGWVGGVKPHIHFHCVLHAKRGWVGPDSI